MFDLKTIKEKGSDNFVKEIKEDVLKDREKQFQSNFKHITYADKIERAKRELLATDPNKVIGWGWNAWDETIGGISGGKIYTIGAESGSGKSTFVNQVCRNLSRQGVRVVKYSLEDRLEDIGKEELFYLSNRFRIRDGKPPYNWIKFVNNDYQDEKEEFLHYITLANEELIKQSVIELEKEKQVSIEDLVRLMELEANNGAKVFVIDHLHYFKMSGKSSRTDLEIQNIMHDINEVARKFDVAILLVAHYRKLNKDKPDNDSFKDASAIKQVSNIIIHITRDYDEGLTNFNISKYRGPVQRKGDIIFSCKFDFATFSYQSMQRVDNLNETLGSALIN